MTDPFAPIDPDDEFDYGTLLADARDAEYADRAAMVNELTTRAIKAVDRVNGPRRRPDLANMPALEAMANLCSAVLALQEDADYLGVVAAFAQTLALKPGREQRMAVLARFVEFHVAQGHMDRPTSMPYLGATPLGAAPTPAAGLGAPAPAPLPLFDHALTIAEQHAHEIPIFKFDGTPGGVVTMREAFSNDDIDVVSSDMFGNPIKAKWNVDVIPPPARPMPAAPTPPTNGTRPRPTQDLTKEVPLVGGSVAPGTKISIMDGRADPRLKEIKDGAGSTTKFEVIPKKGLRERLGSVRPS